MQKVKNLPHSSFVSLLIMRSLLFGLIAIFGSQSIFNFIENGPIYSLYSTFDMGYLLRPNSTSVGHMLHFIHPNATCYECFPCNRIDPFDLPVALNMSPSIASTLLQSLCPQLGLHYDLTSL